MLKKMLPLTVIAFMLGLCANNFAMSGVPANYKVAVVDVSKVVSSSSNKKLYFSFHFSLS